MHFLSFFSSFQNWILFLWLVKSKLTFQNWMIRYSWNPFYICFCPDASFFFVYFLVSNIAETVSKAGILIDLPKSNWNPPFDKSPLLVLRVDPEQAGWQRWAAPSNRWQPADQTCRRLLWFDHNWHNWYHNHQNEDGHKNYHDFKTRWFIAPALASPSPSHLDIIGVWSSP